MPGKHRPRRSRTSARQKGQSIPDNDTLATDDRGTKPYRLSAGERPLDTQSEHPDSETPDSVEIGHPVREEERTTRATKETRATGETGEDEDLPDGTLPDDGGTETDRGNLVREPRNFDDSAR